MIHFRPRYDRLARRLAGAGLRADVVRAAWLSAALPLAALVAAALAGRPLTLPWAWLGGAALFPIALAWGRRRRAAVDAGRDLDRRHGLGELLITAIEVDRRGPASEVERRLLTDAAGALAAVADQATAAGDRETRRELETLAGIALLSLGLVLLGPTGRPPAVSWRLPPMESATGSESHGGGGDRSLGDRSGNGRVGSGGWGGGPLGDLGASLADHPAAGGLAQALAAGDAAAAAREARALAARAPDVSRPGRLDMAAELERAAAAAGADAALAAALREAARSLEAVDSEAMGLGLEDLAAELDRHAGGGQLPGAAPRPPEERIVGERAEAPVMSPAETVPLETAGGEAAVVTGAAREPAAADAATAGGGASRSGRAAAAGPQPGPDRLDVPWPWRSTVRRYFDRTPGGR